MVRELGDHVEVVLDHQHGTADGNLPDHVCDTRNLVARDAGDRLVEQEQLRLQGDRGGELQCALEPVGEGACFDMGVVAKARAIEIRHRFRVERRQAAVGAPEIVGRRAKPLQRGPHVLQCGQ